MIADVFDPRLATQPRVLPILQNFIQEMPVLLLVSSGINKAWVRRRILRLEILDRFKVGSVRDDFGELLQLLQLIQLRFSFFLFSDRSAHNIFPSVVQRTPERQIDKREICSEQIPY